MVLDCQLQHPHLDFTGAAMSQAVTFSLFSVSSTQALIEISQNKFLHTHDSCSLSIRCTPSFSQHSHIHLSFCSSRKSQWAFQASFQWVSASWWEAGSLKVCFPFSVKGGCWDIAYWESYVRGKCHHLSELKRTIFCSLPGSVFLKRNMMMMHCTQKEGGCSTQKERHFYT